MLKLGSSVSWEDALEIVTGQKEMDAKPMLEYFAPLRKWLEKNTDPKKIGWKCPSSSTSSHRSDYFATFIIMVCVFYMYLF